jgi:hypothetical protein
VGDRYPAALDFHEAATGLYDRIVSAPVCVRPTFAESAYRDINDVRPNCAHGVLSHSQTLRGVRPEVVHQDLRGGNQLLHDLKTFGPLHVDCDLTLIAIAR